MSQPECKVTDSNFGNRNNIHQGNNIVNQHYNLTLTQQPPRAPIQSIPFPYPLNEELVKRPDLMDKLNALLPQTSDAYCSAALWGLGGSGKTQIALNYAYERCNDVNCSVFWVHADSEATFSQDYKTIARAFGIDEELKSEDLFVAVRNQIAAQPDWVLILDNADDLRLFGVGQAPEQTKNLFQYIPRALTGTVLWTSRDAHIAGTLVGARRGIEVARMRSDEAEELLTIARDLGTNEEDVKTSALLEELQWLPLAITQAGAYMRRTSTSAKEYSSLLAQSKQRWDILKANEFDRHRRSEVPNNILETWSISIDRLRQESEIAYNILHVLAYVANQNIPHEIITTTLKHCDSNLVQPEKLDAEATKAITRLKEFSFIGMHQMEDGSRSYEIHKLAQEATRYGLSIWKPNILDNGPSNKGGERYFSSIALQVIRDLFPKSEPETWTQCEKYLAHAVQIGDWADLNKKQTETALLFNKVSIFLMHRGRWREKEHVDKRALKIERKMRGEKHPATIISIGHLAITYWALGRYKEAEALQVQALDFWREIYGDKHSFTIQSMGNLTTTYHSQGRYSDAEALQVQVLDLRREILGDKHSETIYSMGDLAATYYGQGRYSEAEAIEVQVLDLRREILGKEHPDTLEAMHNLAFTWNTQDRHSDALALMEECVQYSRSVLGPEHPDTVNSIKALEGWKSEYDTLKSNKTDKKQLVIHSASEQKEEGSSHRHSKSSGVRKMARVFKRFR